MEIQSSLFIDVNHFLCVFIETIGRRRESLLFDWRFTDQSLFRFKFVEQTHPKSSINIGGQWSLSMKKDVELSRFLSNGRIIREIVLSIFQSHCENVIDDRLLPRWEWWNSFLAKQEHFFCHLSSPIFDHCTSHQRSHRRRELLRCLLMSQSNLQISLFDFFENLWELVELFSCMNDSEKRPSNSPAIRHSFFFTFHWFSHLFDHSIMRGRGKECDYLSLWPSSNGWRAHKFHWRLTFFIRTSEDFHLSSFRKYLSKSKRRRFSNEIKSQLGVRKFVENNVPILFRTAVTWTAR